MGFWIGAVSMLLFFAIALWAPMRWAEASAVFLAIAVVATVAAFVGDVRHLRRERGNSTRR